MYQLIYVTTKNSISSAHDSSTINKLTELIDLLKEERDFEELLLMAKSQLARYRHPETPEENIYRNRAITNIIAICGDLEDYFGEKNTNKEKSQSQQTVEPEETISGRKTETLIAWMTKDNRNWISFGIFSFLFIAAQVIFNTLEEAKYLNISSDILNIFISIYCLLVINKYVSGFSTRGHSDRDELFFIKSININYPRFSSDENNDWNFFKTKVNDILHQFVWHYKVIWWSWIFFYVVHISWYIDEQIVHKGNNGVDLPYEVWYTSSLYFFQNLANISFILLFIVMFVTTTTLRNCNNNNEKNEHSVGDYVKLYNRGKFYDDKKIFWSLVLVSGICWALYIFSDFKVLINIFIAATGVFGGVAMCLFVGRVLDNKFVIVPSLVLISLYTYALIRAFYPLVMTNALDIFQPSAVKGITIMLIKVAFWLKMILFFSISWLLDTRRLLYLILEESSLHYKKENDFIDFSLNLPPQK